MGLIDVHNHILSHSQAWVDLLTAHGGHRYHIAKDAEGRRVIKRKAARFMSLTDAMFDPGKRLAALDEGGVERELLSYTCPNGCWADGKMAEQVARVMNDHMAEVCARRLPSLPAPSAEEIHGRRGLSGILRP